MALLFKDPSKISAYRDRRFPGTQEEFEHALLTSTTVYVGNMSFYTTEEQVYELFSRAGEIKKIIMGLDKNTKTPCGFCFVLYYSREDTEDACKYISGTILDDRPIRVDFDWGFQDGRQWGRGRSGGQVRDEYRTDYDPDILLIVECTFCLQFAFLGGYGKLVQKELEVQRQLVDYGTGSLGSFPPVIPTSSVTVGHPQPLLYIVSDSLDLWPFSSKPVTVFSQLYLNQKFKLSLGITKFNGRHGGGHGHGGSHRHGRDYYRKRHRDDDRHIHESSKRNSDHESRRNTDHESRPEKNPRFRESGDSDDDEEDDRKRRA
ncbi:hypothetical protein JHK87_034463 [Glycine soja]|nr:hypothetical protein JHK87_034463 [Glycine soja]